MKLTPKEKTLIRAQPCALCLAMPPFPDGSSCHVHRLISGQAGGQYVRENVISLCPPCHRAVDRVPCITAASRGGRKGGRIGGPRGGPKGGKRAHMLHPHLRKNILAVNARLTHEEHVAYGREGWEKWRQMYPELARENGLKYGPVNGRVSGPTKSTGARKRWQNMTQERRAACIQKGWETRRTRQVKYGPSPAEQRANATASERQRRGWETRRARQQTRAA